MRKLFVLAFSVAFLGLWGCGGGGSTPGGPPPSQITVTISPASAQALVAAPLKFSAAVSGTSNSGVTFSIAEGATGGQITASGDYLAGNVPGTYRVRATSLADPSKVANAVVTVRDYANTIRKASNLSMGHDYHTATLLHDGSVLVVGGHAPSGVNAATERYIPSQNSFVVAGTLGQPRIQHAATALPSGKVLVSGGIDAFANAGTAFDPCLKTSEIYDPATGQFSTGADMAVPRRWHQFTTLKDGRILVTGGIQLKGEGFGATPATELYDSSNGTFALGQTMITGRWLHTATLLNDGRVLLVGGRSNNCPDGVCDPGILASAEIFDPATGSFTPTGSLNLRRFAHTAVLLQDGRVLILGGETIDLPNSDQIATGEIYDPATGQFTVWGTMLGARSYHTMTPLNNGKYLIAGGRNVNGSPTGTTEVFDPTTGNSVSGPDMNDWRYRHTATKLISGEVLIVGGNNSGAPVQVADIYR